MAISERDIKAAVIDRLIEKGWLNDAVLVNEFTVARWTRRADLAIINGKLVGIEIKSDLDNLDRLDGQAQVFREHFDKFILVVSSAQLRRLPEAVVGLQEIWEAKQHKSGIRFRVAHRCSAKPIKSRRTLVGHLLKYDLAALARQHGVDDSANLSRDQLEQIALEMPLSILRPWVLSRLKKRYGRTSAKFLESLDVSETRKFDLRLLSKSYRTVSLAVGDHSEVISSDSASKVPLKTSHLSLSEAELSDLPPYVMRRARPIRNSLRH